MSGAAETMVWARVSLIVAAVALMVVVILTVEHLRGPADVRSGAAPAPRASAAEPIAAEAQVFRTLPSDFAVGRDVERRNAAHPRDLAMFRVLRAYPGAPPRIPHGLTAEEYRTSGCNACHARGGYSLRFASYTPMTPHPEYVDCLGCHLPDARLVGIDFPDRTADAVCHQCHAPEGSLVPGPAGTDWRPAAWPRTGHEESEGSPPLIPHDLQLRGNCVACHYGPAAVEEVRTPHGDRSSCRQCHLSAAPEAGVFTRPVAAAGDQAGGGS